MEVDKGSMTVVGRFDAKKLQARVASKTRKKVDLVGGKDNKGGGGGGDKDKCGDGGGDKNKCADGEGKKEEEKKEQDDKCGGGNAGKGKGGKDNKKPAVPVIVTVVLKIGSAGLHCDGCMHRIRCKLFKIKGTHALRLLHLPHPACMPHFFFKRRTQRMHASCSTEFPVPAHSHRRARRPLIGNLHCVLQAWSR
uniref:HMA domain-containing protein n=1 Tax=Triticum urartu TaxID=4572 RepID=A0A8R7UXJ8_TRIUA